MSPSAPTHSSSPNSGSTLQVRSVRNPASEMQFSPVSGVLLCQRLSSSPLWHQVGGWHPARTGAGGRWDLGDLEDRAFMVGPGLLLTRAVPTSPFHHGLRGSELRDTGPVRTKGWVGIWASGTFLCVSSVHILHLHLPCLCLVCLYLHTPAHPCTHLGNSGSSGFL